MLGKTRAKKMAQVILKKLKKNNVPVNIEEIISQLPSTGIEQLKNIRCSIREQKFPAAVKDISAILLKEKGRATLAINEKDSDERKRFSIAHELGHLILHSNNDEKLTVEKQFFTRAEGVHSLEETEANEFAAELLMPEQLLREDFKNTSKNDEGLISSLAKKYNVSPLACTIRLKNLDLLT
jgi:Zn-dependent peptidase ImmA (M78 family)